MTDIEALIAEARESIAGDGISFKWEPDPELIAALADTLESTSEKMRALRAIHTRQGRPNIAECICGEIVCMTLRTLEATPADSGEEGQ